MIGGVCPCRLHHYCQEENTRALVFYLEHAKNARLEFPVITDMHENTQILRYFWFSHIYSRLHIKYRMAIGVFIKFSICFHLTEVNNLGLTKWTDDFEQNKRELNRLFILEMCMISFLSEVIILKKFVMPKSNAYSRRSYL